MVSKGSEFGGQPGRIAPSPHPLSASEQARLMRAVDPDPERADLPPKPNTVEDQRVVDAGKRGLGPVDAQGNL